MPSKRKTASEADTVPSVFSADSSANASISAKRQRVSRACDQCRAAREKCDGKQPVCFPCVSQNRPCTYDTSPKKRGVQTGYIKTLEVTLAWLFEKVPGTEEALENLLSCDGGDGQSLLAGKESAKSERLHKRWRKSKAQREIDRILSGGQARVDKSSPSDNDEGDTAQSGKTAQRRTQDSVSTEAHARGGNESSSKVSDGLESSSAVSNILKLPPGHWRLLDIYFSYTHCWFPILEKHDLLRTVYLYSAEGLDILRTSTTCASHAELWAALALASYQDSASAKSVIQGASTGSNYSPDELYNIARSLIPSEEGEFDLQHARALLLLALINIGKGKKSSAWVLVGLAHRITLDISEPPRGSVSSSGRVKAVIMGCHILDTLISLHRRGMPGLETTAAIEGMSIAEDSLDEWQPWAPCNGFGQSHPGSSASSRSPAYSLTTFNQFYEVIKFLKRRSLQRKDGTLLMKHPAEDVMLLHQTIKPRLPFAEFITAKDSITATTPSAYVLRLLFLWASVMLETTKESASMLILDTIEQYIFNYGAHGAPPFFATCLATMSQHRSFEDLHPQSRDRWNSVKDALTSVWTATRSISSKSSHLSSNASGTASPPGVPVVSSGMHTFMHPCQSISATTQSDLGYPTEDLHTPTLPAMHHSPKGGNFMLGSPSSFKPVLKPELGPAAPVTNIALMNARSTIHDGPAPPFGHHQQHSMGPGDGIAYCESINGPMIDFDTLLDDLSSMDYIDRVDADPHFMANLGFVPGADITGILSRDFGTV